MSAFEDLSGQTFHRLSVLSCAREQRATYVVTMCHCRCDCGNEVDVAAGKLKSGHTKSCGCFQAENRHKRLINLLGQRFGRLKVILYAGVNIFEQTLWLCDCDCGKQRTAAAFKLRNGEVQSCGCLLVESWKDNWKKNRTHGLTHTRVFKIWIGMMSRCDNLDDLRYGGRGITVCGRWHDPLTFAADLGEPDPGMSIERIDNDGPYAPENCRWATQREQNRNKRRNVFVEFNGRRQLLADWARELRMDHKTISYRLKQGWPIEDVLGGITRRQNMTLTFQGATLPLHVWAQRVGISRNTLALRLDYGWDAEKTLTTPVRISSHSPS